MGGKRAFDDAHDLLDLMSAEAGSTVRVERFIGHMGMFSRNHLEVHLSNDLVRLNGGYAEMLRIPNSNHGSSNSGNNIVRRAQNEAMLEWFQRYIPVENGSNTERGFGHA